MPQVPGVMWVQAGGEVSDRPGTHRSGSLSTGSSIGRLFQPAEEACEVSRRVIDSNHPDDCSSRSSPHVTQVPKCHMIAATAVPSYDT